MDRTFTTKHSDPGVWLMRDAKSPLALHIDGFLAAKRLAPKSRRDYGRYLREFDTFTGHVSLEEALNIDNAALWLDELRKRGISTPHNGCAYLKSFASWVAKQRYIVVPGGGSLLAGLEMPKMPASTRNAFSDDQIDAIIKALGDRPNRDRDRALAYVWLLLATGLRRNEARQLALADLHLDQEGDRSWVHVRWQTSKGSKERKVRLDRVAAGPISDYISTARYKYTGPRNKPEPLFTTEGGTMFTENGFGTWAGRIGADIQRETGIHWHSHLMRHTWATQFHRSSRDTGLTVYDLKDEGGWADLNTPLRYTHQRPFEERLEIPTALSVLRKRRMASA